MSTTADFDRQRGREAERPSEIPGRGFKDVLLRVKDQLAKDHVGILAGGIAFYALLAIFPTLIALVSLYALIADPVSVEQQAREISGVLPSAAHQLMNQQLGEIIKSSPGKLSLGLFLSLAAVLWSASAGTMSLMEGVNIAYDERETRSFIRRRGMALVMAALLVVAGLASLGLIAVLPVVLGAIGLGSAGETLISIGRWPVLAAGVIIGLAALYRYAPNRTKPRWRWVSWGAVTATVVWIAASVGLSIYVENFGNYNKTYGALAGVIVLMLWLYVSMYAILLGAELDAELEAQTRKDSTVGPQAPMGERGAVKADELGRSYR